MNSLIRPLAVCLVALAPAAAQSQPSTPDDSAWVRWPAAEEIWAAIPERAFLNPEAVTGLLWAELQCQVTAEGELTECAVTREAFEGGALGEAALALAPKYALAPGRARTEKVVMRLQPRSPITPPSFPAEPTGQQKFDAWPAAARAADISGVGRFTCLSGADGYLKDCRPMAETPEGSGFSLAAMSLAPSYYQTPATRDGLPVATQTTIALAFNSSLELQLPGGPCSTPRPDPVVAPCPGNQREVADWARNLGITQTRNFGNVREGEGVWRLAQADARSATFVYRPLQTIRRNSPMELYVRKEYFQPEQLDGQPVLSEVSILDLDCAAGTLSTRGLVRFPERALYGAAKNTPVTSSPRKPEAGDFEFRQALEFCQLVTPRLPNIGFTRASPEDDPGRAALASALGGGGIQIQGPSMAEINPGR